MHDRKDQERAFHNARFAKNGEFQRPADRFYNIAYRSNHAFRGRLLSICPGKRVLEIGCGQGDLSLILARTAAFATGIDISEVAVENAANAAASLSLENTKFRVMDAEKIDLPSGTFDLICGSGILHHLRLESALPEVARLLAPGGHAVFTEPLGHNPFVNLYRRVTPSQRTRDEHPLTSADIAFVRKQFDEVELQYFYLSALLAAPLATKAWVHRMVDTLNALDVRLFAVLPPLRKYAWIVMLDLSNPLGDVSGFAATP